MTDGVDKRRADLTELLSQLTGLILNERVASYNEGVDAERERCAQIAEHLSGWGIYPLKPELAIHIARVIRDVQ